MKYDVQITSILVYAMIIATINIWKSAETDRLQIKEIPIGTERHSQYDRNY